MGPSHRRRNRRQGLRDGRADRRHDDAWSHRTLVIAILFVLGPPNASLDPAHFPEFFGTLSNSGEVLGERRRPCPIRRTRTCPARSGLISRYKHKTSTGLRSRARRQLLQPLPEAARGNSPSDRLGGGKTSLSQGRARLPSDRVIWSCVGRILIQVKAPRKSAPKISMQCDQEAT